MATCAATIDWAATGTMLQGIGTIVGALAVIGAAAIGANTFSRWRDQKLAERRIEQAEKIITAAYNARRQLSHIRSVMMHGHELHAARQKLIEDGYKPDDRSDDDQRRLETQQAYYLRLNRSVADQDHLRECLPMARAIFGEDLERAMEKLLNQFWIVKVYVDANARDRGHSDTEFAFKINRAIYEGDDITGPNEVDEAVKAAVRTIEDACVPVLRANVTPVRRLFGLARVGRASSAPEQPL